MGSLVTQPGMAVWMCKHQGVKIGVGNLNLSSVFPFLAPKFRHRVARYISYLGENNGVILSACLHKYVELAGSHSYMAGQDVYLCFLAIPSSSSSSKDAFENL